MMKILLVGQYDAEIESDPHDLQRTVWHYAAGALQKEALQVLCADEFKLCAAQHINAVDKLGRTPLHYALLQAAAVGDAWAKGGRERRLTHMVSKPTGLGRKKSVGNVWKVSNSVKGVDQVQEQLIYECVDLLIGAGAAINSTINPEIVQQINSRGRRASAQAIAQFGSTALHLAAAAAQTKVLRLLCTHHAETSQPDHMSRTPLHLACWAGSADAVQTLLQHGSDPNVKNGAGRTPIAVASVYGHIDAIRTVPFIHYTHTLYTHTLHTHTLHTHTLHTHTLYTHILYTHTLHSYTIHSYAIHSYTIHSHTIHSHRWCVRVKSLSTLTNQTTRARLLSSSQYKTSSSHAQCKWWS
jgi:hypothetical protein